MAQAAGHITVKIQPNDKGNPAGKLADAEAPLHRRPSGRLEADWVRDLERRAGAGRNVALPARQYSVNGERRSFTAPCSITDALGQDAMRDLVLAAYAAYEEASATRA